jgi:acetoacetate decarboxylase
MDLVLYNDLDEFSRDLIKFSIIEAKDVEEFLKDAQEEKIITIFFDTEEGKFSCYMWLKNKKTIKEYEIIDSIAGSWAYYSKISDSDILLNLKTCSLLSYSILMNLNK